MKKSSEPIGKKSSKASTIWDLKKVYSEESTVMVLLNLLQFNRREFSQLSKARILLLR